MKSSQFNLLEQIRQANQDYKSGGHYTPHGLTDDGTDNTLNLNNYASGDYHTPMQQFNN